MNNELKEFLKAHPHIKEVYFTADEAWHTRAFEWNGEKYSKLVLKNEGFKGVGVIENKIVLTVTREEALAESVQEQQAEPEQPRRRNGST